MFVLDLLIGQQAVLTVKVTGVPLVPKQKVQRGRGKELAPMKSNRKEKAPSKQSIKAPQAKGALKKKLPVEAI